MIRFHLKWWMDTNRFIQGTSIHPPDPNTFLFTGQSLWIGSLISSRWDYPFMVAGLKTNPRSISMIMTIPFTLKKAIKYIHHSCVMISTDNTTVVSYINRQGGTHSPNLCVDVWEILHWCLEYNIMISSSYSRQIQYIGRLSLEIEQTSQNGMGFGSIGGKFHFPNAQLSQCGFVCDMIQSQTPIVCISSSGQSCLSDRHIINEL